MDGARADRVLWRCRRGMKELDLLLERFAREHYARAPEAQKRAFERLLDLPDPLIVELLLDPAELGRTEGPSAAPHRFGLLPADRELAEVAALVAARGRR